MDACLVGWCVSLLEFALEPPPVYAEGGGAHAEGGGGAAAEDTAAARGQIAARGLSQERRARLAAAAASFAVFVAGEAPAARALGARRIYHLHCRIMQDACSNCWICCFRVD